MRNIILFFLIFCSIKTYSGNENFPVGSRSAGMGNASVANPDFWSIHHNQAGLAYISSISAGVYFENRFLISSMGIKSLGVVFPTNSGVLGLSFNNYGYSLYNEQKIGLSFAKMLHEKFAMGVQLDYLSNTIQEYGSKSVVTFEVGVMASLTKQLILGAHIYNPINAKLSSTDLYDERVPSILRVGVGYTFSEKVLFSIETEKDIYFKSVFKAGVEYHVIDILYLRTGIATNPTLNTFGFGIDYNGLKFDVASGWHQILGITPQFSLIYELNKKGK